MILCPTCDEGDVEFLTHFEQLDGTTVSDCKCGQCHTTWRQHYEVELVPIEAMSITPSMFGGANGKGK